MKKNKIIIGLLLTASFLGMTSCNDWLDLQPENAVPKSEYWKTKEDVASATTGLYCGMLASVVSSKMVLWGEVRADMLTEGRSVWNAWD